MSENRVPLTVRMSPELKAAFARAVAAAGMEPGTAARQLMEIIAQPLARGEEYLDVLQTVRAALKPRVRVQAGRAP